MPQIVLEIRGLEALLKRLGDPNLVTGAIATALDKSVKELQDRLAHYPPRPAGIRMQFVSERQRRWFFAALSRGEIQVPYRRTGTLGRSITTQVDRAQLVGRVGTKLGYAPYVIGPQQARHMGHWHTTADVTLEALPQIQGYFAEAGREITVKLAGE